MSEFVLRLETGWPPSEAWQKLWDLHRHTAVIPLTTVRLLPPARTLAQDATFCARTSLGRWGFDDTMQVLDWQPPTTGNGHAAVQKTGRVLRGRIEVDLAPRSPIAEVRAPSGASSGAGNTDVVGTRITWRQQVELPWLPSPVSGLENLAARLMAPGYRMVLRRLLA